MVFLDYEMHYELSVKDGMQSIYHSAWNREGTK